MRWHEVASRLIHLQTFTLWDKADSARPRRIPVHISWYNEELPRADVLMPLYQGSKKNPLRHLLLFAQWHAWNRMSRSLTWARQMQVGGFYLITDQNLRLRTGRKYRPHRIITKLLTVNAGKPVISVGPFHWLDTVTYKVRRLGGTWAGCHFARYHSMALSLWQLTDSLVEGNWHKRSEPEDRQWLSRLTSS